MNPNLERGLLLYQQSRHELAEVELRQALAAEPGDAYPHAVLALCLAEREQLKEATDEAHQAIHLAPDFPFAHYALARVMHSRERNDEALAAIQEAIRLDASDADLFAQLAAIQISKKRWPAAFEAAEQGLQLDSEHIGCTNLRAIALVKLGRKAEAGATIDAALARNPDNSVTHANQGWTLLEHGEPKKALEHFRESLRLDPENEWARQGIVEALKARHIIYALMLRYFLWMSRFGARGQWAIILIGYFGYRLLGGLARSNPELAPWLLPIQILYLTFALLTWIADPFFNLLLRLNRFGRLALSREQFVASNWIGSFIFFAVVGLAGCIAFGFESTWLIVAAIFGFLVLPLAGVFKCASGWPRTVMALYTGALGLLGSGAIVVFVLVDNLPKSSARELAPLAKSLFGLFVIGVILSTWLVNLLVFKRPRH